MIQLDRTRTRNPNLNKGNYVNTTALAIINHSLRKKFWEMDPQELLKTWEKILQKGDEFVTSHNCDIPDDDLHFLQKALSDMRAAGKHSSVTIYEMAKVRAILRMLTYPEEPKQLAA